MKIISSKDNPQFKMWRKIADSSKAIQEFGYFIISGKKLVHEALLSNRLDIRSEIITDHQESLLGQKGFRLPPGLFNQLDVLGTGYNLLVAKAPELEAWDPLIPPEGIEVIAPLGDPKNLGSLTRSCVAFGVKKIILTTESCYPFLPAAIKAASSSCFEVEYVQGPSLSLLTGEFYALDLEGQDIRNFTPPKNFRFLVGQEGQGLKLLPSDSKVQKLTIPTRSVESLNATVAASIALFSFYQCRTS